MKTLSQNSGSVFGTSEISGSLKKMLDQFGGPVNQSDFKSFCKILNIDPMWLQQKNLQEFINEEKGDEQIARIKYDHYDKRRRAKINQIREYMKVLSNGQSNIAQMQAAQKSGKNIVGTWQLQKESFLLLKDFKNKGGQHSQSQSAVKSKLGQYQQNIIMNKASQSGNSNQKIAKQINDVYLTKSLQNKPQTSKSLTKSVSVEGTITEEEKQDIAVLEYFGVKDKSKYGFANSYHRPYSRKKKHMNSQRTLDFLNNDPPNYNNQSIDYIENQLSNNVHIRPMSSNLHQIIKNRDKNLQVIKNKRIQNDNFNNEITKLRLKSAHQAKKIEQNLKDVKEMHEYKVDKVHKNQIAAKQRKVSQDQVFEKKQQDNYQEMIQRFNKVDQKLMQQQSDYQMFLKGRSRHHLDKNGDRYNGSLSQSVQQLDMGATGQTGRQIGFDTESDYNNNNYGDNPYHQSNHPHNQSMKSSNSLSCEFKILNERELFKQKMEKKKAREEEKEIRLKEQELERKLKRASLKRHKMNNDFKDYNICKSQQKERKIQEFFANEVEKYDGKSTKQYNTLKRYCDRQKKSVKNLKLDDQIKKHEIEEKRHKEELKLIGMKNSVAKAKQDKLQEYVEALHQKEEKMLLMFNPQSNSQYMGNSQYPMSTQDSQYYHQKLVKKQLQEQDQQQNLERVKEVHQKYKDGLIIKILEKENKHAQIKGMQSGVRT